MRAESTDHARVRSRWSSWLRDRILKSLYSRIAGLLYVGQRSREHFLRLGCAEDKLTFSPYCVDPAPFRTSEQDRELLRGPMRRGLGILPHQRVLLFSGKLSKRKGVDILIEAVRSLPEGLRMDAVIVFLGDGELRHDLEERAKTEPHVAVRFVGFQNQSRLSAYYHAADLLVLPSIHSETWGLAVNEAMHHGVATVVSEGVGCGPDLVEVQRTGEICRTGDPQALAQAIERALGWCTNREVRDWCRNRVARYSIAEAAKGIAHAFGSVALAKESLVTAPSN